MKEIRRPTLIINEKTVRNNLERLTHKFANKNISFRPHFKTHQSAQVANWYRDYGVSQICVSSVQMAQYFAANGWNDITIAFPYNWLEAAEINDLASKIKLNLLIESAESLVHASTHIHHNAGYFVKCDVGTHRTGLELHQLDELALLSESPGEAFQFMGLLAHAGHTYGARGKDEIVRTHQQSIKVLDTFRNSLNQKGIVSYGDTPSCSVADNFEGVDEVRCGNFAYYDLMQEQIGSCSLQDIGVALACPVVANHPLRGEKIIYGGAVHFSKDFIFMDGKKIFGQVVEFTGTGWEIVEGVFLTGLSQEHGTISGPPEKIDKFGLGSIVGILPVHSCLAADLMNGQQTLDGKKITKMTKI